MRPDPSTERVISSLSVPRRTPTTRPVGSDESTPVTCAAEDVGSPARVSLISAALIDARNEASKCAAMSGSGKGTSGNELNNHASCVPAGSWGRVVETGSAVLVGRVAPSAGDPERLSAPQAGRASAARIAAYPAARRRRLEVPCGHLSPGAAGPARSGLCILAGPQRNHYCLGLAGGGAATGSSSVRRPGGAPAGRVAPLGWRRVLPSAVPTPRRSQEHGNDRTRQPGPHRLPARARLHGHVATSTGRATTPSRSPPSSGRSTSGVTFFDTSDMYGPHTNEELVGQALAGRRDEAVIATKFGIVRDPDDPTKRGISGRPEYVREACDGVARPARHRPHRPLLPAPRRPGDADRGDRGRDGRAGRAGQGALPRAVGGGAGHHPPRARRAPDRGARRPSIDLVARSRGRDPPTLRELGIGFVPYSPLGRGLPHRHLASLDELDADRLPSLPARVSRATTWPHNMAIVEIIDTLAAAKGCTPGQIALAWVHAAGRRRRADTRHEARALPRRERGRARRRAQRGGPRHTRRGGRSRATATPTCRRSTAEDHARQLAEACWASAMATIVRTMVWTGNWRRSRPE